VSCARNGFGFTGTVDAIVIFVFPSSSPSSASFSRSYHVLILMFPMIVFLLLRRLLLPFSQTPNACSLSRDRGRKLESTISMRKKKKKKEREILLIVFKENSRSARE